MTQPPDPQKPDPNDPLESLHRMSRTAGVGTQEYVAVNAAAVAALLLGLLSSAAVLSDILLVLPAAAVIVALVGLVQIKNSGGTQTGKGLALGGLALSLLFVGWVGGRAWIRQREVRAEEGQIVALLDQLSKDITARDYEAAWKRFGKSFRQQVRKAEFLKKMQDLESIPGYGPIKGVRWNTRLNMQIDANTGVKLANGVILVDTATGPPDRWNAVFRKDREQPWLIEDVENQWFIKHPIIPEELQPTPLLPLE